MTGHLGFSIWFVFILSERVCVCVWGGGHLVLKICTFATIQEWQILLTVYC